MRASSEVVNNGGDGVDDTTGDGPENSWHRIHNLNRPESGGNVESVLRSIIEGDEDERLRQYIAEADPEQLRICQEDLVHDCVKVPVFRITIEMKALKCAVTLLELGLKTTESEPEELMKIALEKEDVDAIEKIIHTTGSEIEMMEAFLRLAAQLCNSDACHKSFDAIERIVSVNRTSVSAVLGDGSTTDEQSNAALNVAATYVFHKERADEEGNTALHIAAKSNSKSAEEVMKLLLARRPNLMEVKNKQGRTPLHEAVLGNV